MKSLKLSAFIILCLAFCSMSFQYKTKGNKGYHKQFILQDTIPPGKKLVYDSVRMHDPQTYEEMIVLKSRIGEMNETGQWIKEKVKYDVVITFDPYTYKEIRKLVFSPPYYSIKSIVKTKKPERIPIDTIITFDPDTYEQIYYYRYADGKMVPAKNKKAKNKTTTKVDTVMTYDPSTGKVKKATVKRKN